MWNAGGKLPACTRSRLRNGLPFSRSDAVTAYRRFSRIPLQSAARSSHADSFPPGEAKGAAAPVDHKGGLPHQCAHWFAMTEIRGASRKGVLQTRPYDGWAQGVVGAGGAFSLYTTHKNGILGQSF